MSRASRKNVNGEDDERVGTNESHLKLLLKVVDRDEFAVQWHGRWSVVDIARKWDITEPDATALRYYWCLPDRQKVSSGSRAFKSEEIFDRLIGQLRAEVQPMIKQMVDEAVWVALSS